MSFDTQFCGVQWHVLSPKKKVVRGSNSQPRDAISQIAATLSVLCCYLTNTIEELRELARAIAPFDKLLWYLLYKNFKMSKVVIALYAKPIAEYGALPSIWDHTVLPATQRRLTRPALTSARQAGIRFINLGGMIG